MTEFTRLLGAAEAGDAHATAGLFELVYDELKQIAAASMANENSVHTLQPTALVHEAYLRLLGSGRDGSQATEQRWEGRGHFFAAAAQAMRRILIEAARRKKMQKLGGGRQRVFLDPDQIAEPEVAEDLLALDEALAVFASAEPKIAELVHLRCFAGLTLKEAAAVLEMAPRTADAHWAYARAWLLTEIRRADSQPG